MSWRGMRTRGWGGRGEFALYGEAFGMRTRMEYIEGI